jgi:hypothetical protein
MLGGWASAHPPVLAGSSPGIPWCFLALLSSLGSLSGMEGFHCLQGIVYVIHMSATPGRMMNIKAFGLKLLLSVQELMIVICNIF